MSGRVDARSDTSRHDPTMSGVALKPHSHTDQGTGVITAEGDEDHLSRLYVVTDLSCRLDTLESRREHLTERFFKRNVLRESS